MNENFSDIVRIFPIYQPALSYALPMQIMVESITPTGMGIVNFDTFLSKTVYFTQADVDIAGPAGGTYYGLNGTPDLKLTPSKDINGLIYKATLSFSFENLSDKGRAYLKAMSALDKYDVIVQRANGNYELMRALCDTSAFSYEEETRKDQVVKAKIEMKILGLTPIII